MYIQSDWQLLVSSSGAYSWDQSQSDIRSKCRSVYSGLLNLSLPVCKNYRNMWKILHKDFTTGFTVCVRNDQLNLVIHPSTSVKSFSHCFLVYGSFVAHCIGRIDLQASNPRILSVRPQVKFGMPLKCGSMRYITLSQFGCFSFCKIQSWWNVASCTSIHRHAMMCSETEGSHFKMYCKTTNKICRPKIFFLSFQVMISS